MRSLFEKVLKVAPTDSTVLITGESGTGKELIAKAIHAYSERKDDEFVAVDCSSLVETLLESELFGHVKGALTGADFPNQMILARAEPAPGKAGRPRKYGRWGRKTTITRARNFPLAARTPHSIASRS